MLLSHGDEHGDRVVINRNCSLVCLLLRVFEPQPMRLGLLKGPLNAERLLCGIEIAPPEGQRFIAPAAGERQDVDQREQHRPVEASHQRPQFIIVEHIVIKFINRRNDPDAVDGVDGQQLLAHRRAKAGVEHAVHMMAVVPDTFPSRPCSSLREDQAGRVGPGSCQRYRRRSCDVGQQF
jgi:hypothetical protein